MVIHELDDFGSTPTSGNLKDASTEPQSAATKNVTNNSLCYSTAFHGFTIVFCDWAISVYHKFI